jgi:hypothetical protein
VERIIEEIEKDYSKEMSGIEDVLKNVLKSKVIVYDLARGFLTYFVVVFVNKELHSSDEMFTYFREMPSIFLIHMDILAIIFMCFYLKELF